MAGLNKVGKGIVTHFRKLTLRVSRRHRSTSTHSADASTAESAVLHTDATKSDPDDFLKPSEKHADMTQARGSQAKSFPTESKSQSDLFGKDANDDAKGKATDEIDKDPEIPPMLTLDDNPTPPFTFVDQVPEDLVCPICLDTLRNPTLTSCCGHRFCLQCIRRALFARNHCAMCRALSPKTLVDKRTTGEMNELSVRCEVAGCSWSGKYEDLRDHDCSDETHPNSPRSTPTPPTESSSVSPASTRVESRTPCDNDLDTAVHSEDACPSTRQIYRPKKRHKQKRKTAKVPNTIPRYPCESKMRKGKQHPRRPTGQKPARNKHRRVELSIPQSLRFALPPQSNPVPEKVLFPRKGGQRNQQLKGYKLVRKKGFESKKTPQQPRPGRNLKSPTKEKRKARKAKRAAKVRSVERGKATFIKRRTLSDSSVGEKSQLVAQTMSPYVSGTSSGSIINSSSSSSEKASPGSQSGGCSGSSQQQTCGVSGGGDDGGSEDDDKNGDTRSDDEEEVEEEKEEDRRKKRDEDKDEEELEKRTETKSFSQDNVPFSHDGATGGQTRQCATPRQCDVPERGCATFIERKALMIGGSSVGVISHASGSSSTKSKRSGTGSHRKKVRRRNQSRACSSSPSTSRGTSSGNAGGGSESEDELRERKNPHRHELQQSSSESDTDSSDLETSDHEETEHPQPQSPSLSPKPSLPAVAEPSTKNGTAERKFSATVPCLPHRGSKGPPRSQSFPSDKGTKDDIVSGTAPTKPPVSESNPQSEGCELVVPTGKTFKRLYRPTSSIAPGFSSLQTRSQSIALPPALKSFAASSPTQPVGKGNQRCAFARASQDRSYCAEKSRPVAGISLGRKNNASEPVERLHRAETSRLVMGTSRRENSSVNVRLASCTVEVKVFDDGVGLHPSQLGGTRIQVFLISCASKADLQGLLKVLKSLIECRVIYRDCGLPFSLCPPAVWIVPGDSTEEHTVTLERTGCTLHQDCTAFVESLVEILDSYERTRRIFSCGQSERGGVAQFFRSCCDEVVLGGDVLDEEALLKIVAMMLRE